LNDSISITLYHVPLVPHKNELEDADEFRMAIVLSIKQLQKLSDEDLYAHISTISDPIVSNVVRFLVECGEPGLVGEIVKFMAQSNGAWTSFPPIDDIDKIIGEAREMGCIVATIKFN
jgi:hypothetical protein